MRKPTRILVLVPLLLTILGFGTYHLAVKVKGQDNINVGLGLIKQRLGFEVALENEELGKSTPTVFEEDATLDETIRGFQEIGESLGELAKGNNVIVLRGMATFDANGDGLQDIYFVHSGRPTARPSNESHVLQMDDRVKAKPNTLFLNQGNDKDGNPIFKSVPELIGKQETRSHTMEELLIENKYTPRTSIEEDPYREGRIGQGVITADFNGDKKVDILVLNAHYGTPFTIPGLGLRIYPAANHLGREDKQDFIEALAPEFLSGDGKDGTQNTYRGEGEGMNTLFLNKGDQDNDGIPEWENVTKHAGLTSNFCSLGGTVADIDRDGDLDIFIGNFVDPDFWGFGIEHFPGNPNTLYINQLAETGELRFKESAQAYGVDGVYAHNNIDYFFPLPDGSRQDNPGKLEHKGQQMGQEANHSWAAMMTDFNRDGYPDLIVANDIPNRMEAYVNVGGERFEFIEDFNNPKYIGCWMGIGYGDLNGDGTEEFLATNCGSNVYSIRNTSLLTADRDELNVTSVAQINGLQQKGTLSHTLFQLENNRFNDVTKEMNVRYNPLTSPDVSNPNNVHPDALPLFKAYQFDQNISGAEFSWAPSIFDVENDGDLDVYLVGALNRGNDNFIGDWSGGVGRLLENNTDEQGSVFIDKTYEYQLFNIAEMDYSEFPAKKPAPGTGWHKENYVYFTDRDSYSGVGIDASSSSEIKDIFRMHEAANVSVASDLNGDGNVDLIVPNGAGYSSVSENARNLKVDLMGQAFAVPPPNKVVKAPTSFEEGSTFVYINKNENENNWVKLLLDNGDSNNKYGIGAKVVVNGKIIRTVVLGGRNVSMNHEPLHIGLGNDDLKSVEVFWPDGSVEPQRFEFEESVRRKTITLSRAYSQKEKPYLTEK